MAATEDAACETARAARPSGFLAASSNALLAAAIALPGVAPSAAHAQSAVEQGVIAFKYLDYRDWQPGADRMHVKTPALFVLKPLSETLEVEGSLVYDSISGASPLNHDTLSGASGIGITEYRTAGDVKVTKYFGGRYAIGVGAAASSERDYLSRAGSLDFRWWSEDHNTTLTFGTGGASDRINSVNGVAVGETRHTLDFLAGITQALTPQDIVLSNVTYSTGHGYYSDPYKLLDTRPDKRRVFAWLTRFNHHFIAYDSTLQAGYRYLHDSFGDDAHTFDLAWVQPLPRGFTLTPSLRYTTQGAADFYFDPPFPHGFRRGELYTADTRLSAFGAFTAGVKLSVGLADGWGVDLKWQGYRQESSWRLGGSGSPGLEPFSARWVELGISKAL